ncbi:AAA family ATPase [Rugamonas sp. CCM 8940]|uniref:ATP-binding protein n=1 Tax=Rugamonas sp. CCM 8940 TaxID=2765359 RepID=UPI0018F29A8B|nr:ATP-binding protein [Rugamonas sp. CCM 8940]MBJ7312689.1 AAA family ATPase [Rugamonas sp. CCM 8940]
MTLHKPTIFVNRLVVMKGGRSVMDISFHAGLNIITGENSSGKTTAIRFIAYALGSEGISFNQVAQLCDDIYLEVTANDAVVTLRRGVSTQLMRPLSIFWGTMQSALAAGASLWQQFPFKRSEMKESFSQVLFRMLDMPELRGEGGSNITMHQLMRLIYSDQETPSSDLFRFDRFDRGITRAAVGDYLLGIDSTELYDLKLLESTADKDASAIRVSIRTIYSTFGNSGTNISLEFLDNQIQTLGSEILFLQSRLESIDSGAASKTSSSKEDNELRAKLSEAHMTLSKLKEKKVDLETEIADSELFLRELEERMFSLEESAAAESHLGTAVFSFCPSCFTKLQPPEANQSSCALCKSDVAEDSARSQLARMKNELALQLRESGIIRIQQLEELDKIVLEIPSAQSRLKSLEAEFKRNQAHWRSPDHILMQSISKEIGGKEQEIKNALELKKLADLLGRLTDKLGEIEAKQEWIKGRIEAVTREQEGRRNSAYLSVANNLKAILKDDLSRQAEFERADSINIDFGANQLSIDGQREFSASSMVFLRHGFHLALLLSSLELPYFRYPRLLILDGVEDGGMEVERSYNFQKIIARHSSQSKVVHQIIMTTMSVCPELDTSEYIVGRKFTHEEKSIDIQAGPTLPGLLPS